MICALNFKPHVINSIFYKKLVIRFWKLTYYTILSTTANHYKMRNCIFKFNLTFLKRTVVRHITVFTWNKTWSWSNGTNVAEQIGTVKTNIQRFTATH